MLFCTRSKWLKIPRRVLSFCSVIKNRRVVLATTLKLSRPFDDKSMSLWFLNFCCFSWYFRPKSLFSSTRSITRVICWISKACPPQKTIQNTLRESHRASHPENLLLILRSAALKTLIASQVTWDLTTPWSLWKCVQVLSSPLLAREAPGVKRCIHSDKTIARVAVGVFHS